MKKTDLTLQDILFIGFDDLIGVNNVSWFASDFINPIDYDVTFINGVSLNNIIERSKEEMKLFGANSDDMHILQKNMHLLHISILQLLYTDRIVFAYFLPHTHAKLGNIDLEIIAIDSYGWLPFSITLPSNIHSGKKIDKSFVDERFRNYAQFITEWDFYFEHQAQVINISNIKLLESNKPYIAVSKTLFRNRALESLGLEIKYQQGNLNDPDATLCSGSLFLLHPPRDEFVNESLQTLLRDFYDITLHITDAPSWVDTVPIPHNTRIRGNIKRINSEISMLQEELRDLSNEESRYRYWQSLLYLKGKPLEVSVYKAFRLLEIDVKEGPTSKHDLEVDDKEGLFIIFEVKGLDKAVKRSHVSQLTTHMYDSVYDSDDGVPPKGVLIYNAYRGIHPTEREAECGYVVAPNAIELGKKNNVAFIDTRDLYRLVIKKLEGKDIDPDELLHTITTTIGIVDFGVSDIPLIS